MYRKNPLSRLKQVDDLTAQDVQTNAQFYEIEKLLDDKVEKCKRFFLVKWKGYPESDNSWIPETHFSTPDIVTTYDKVKTAPININNLKIKSTMKSSTHLRPGTYPHLWLLFLFQMVHIVTSLTIRDDFKYCCNKVLRPQK